MLIQMCGKRNTYSLLVDVHSAKANMKMSVGVTKES